MARGGAPANRAPPQSVSSFRGREHHSDEPLGAAGVGAGAKIAVAERFRADRAPDPRVAVRSPRSHSLSDDDESGAECGSDRERSPVQAAALALPPPATPAGRLEAVVAALVDLEAEAAPLTGRSARDRSPWPADAKKTATRVSEMATQALLKLDSIDPPDGDPAFRAARKAAIVRANALGDAMDALKARIP